MAKVTKRTPLDLTEEQVELLTKLAQSRTSPVREIERANILLRYHREESISQIGEALQISRPTVYKCIDKALAMGADAGLRDKYHRPKPPQITQEAKSWVINLACTKPKDHGYAAEIWSLNHLAKHARKHGPSAGHECLQKAGKATIHRILKAHPIQPHKMRYYLERRDPDFENKLQAVLLVYQEVNLLNARSGDEPLSIVTVSVDEKPGVQAIQNLAPDLLPTPSGSHPDLRRDYEYKRLGTLSIIAAVDLHTGHVFVQAHKRHRSQEFIELLKELDAYYPKECKIRIILDNHSSHISKETQNYLASCPNRFVYVHTPKHGSWLNLIETVFGKMARTFLKRIRVNSLEELKERILKGVEEINAEPHVHRWNKFDWKENPL